MLPGGVEDVLQKENLMHKPLSSAFNKPLDHVCILDKFRLRKDRPGYFPLLIYPHVHMCREILSVQAS